MNLDHARTHLVDQIQEDFVLGQIAQRRHQKLGIESDREIAPLVNHGQRFLGFTDLGGIGGDIDVVLAEAQFDRIRFIAGQERDPAQRIQERLPLQGHALFGLGGDDLAIVGIISLDQLGNEESLAQVEGNLA